jgi:hypothetical protein
MWFRQKFPAGTIRPTISIHLASVIPFRLDQLPWSRFHLLVVWILDGLEITIVGSLGPALQSVLLTPITQTVAWFSIFFFASAAASSAYLTASEIFPLETRYRMLLRTGHGHRRKYVAAPVWLAHPVWFGLARECF